MTAYVSWNGATDVARWELLGGAAAGSLTPLGAAAKDGFETVLRADTQPFVAVRAYDAAGTVLTTSAPVRPRSG